MDEFDVKNRILFFLQIFCYFNCYIQFIYKSEGRFAKKENQNQLYKTKMVKS